MSLRATLWALYEAPVENPTQALVLVVLADHAGDDGRDAWPSVSTIAKGARVSERSVQRSLRELETAGLITPGDQESAARAAKRKNYVPTVYDLVMTPRGDNLTPLDPEGGVTPTSPLDESGVTSEASRGDTGDAPGVTPVSPEPKRGTKERNRKAAAVETTALEDDEVAALDVLPSDPVIAKRWAELKAHNAATAWHNKLKDDGVKLPDSSRTFHALRTMLIPRLTAGYSRRQIWDALIMIGEPCPAKQQYDRVLRTLDQKVGNVNEGWTADDYTPPTP